MLSTWLSLTNEIKPSVSRSNKMFTMWNPLPVVSEPNPILKPGVVLVLGHWQIAQIKIRHRRTRHLIRVCVICLLQKLTVKCNSRKSTFRIIYPAYIQWQSTCTHQCCQCFDLQGRQFHWIHENGSTIKGGLRLSEKGVYFETRNFQKGKHQFWKRCLPLA